MLQYVARYRDGMRTVLDEAISAVEGRLTALGHPPAASELDEDMVSSGDEGESEDEDAGGGSVAAPPTEIVALCGVAVARITGPGAF